MGEATSDYLVRVVHPIPAVGLGFVGFVVALVLQFSMRRYLAWTYWFAVAMVGVFGTMAADVLHVGFGVPYVDSALFFAVLLAVVFALWQKTEKTLSIHSIDTARREAFYWAVVVATFALGTALGDMTAATLHLGYFLSIVLFAVIIAIPAIGYWRFKWNPVFAFWFAYVVTRPLGASFADWVGRPASSRGLGWGEGRLSLLLTILIVCFVAYLAATRKDVQRDLYELRPATDPPGAEATRDPRRPAPPWELPARKEAGSHSEQAEQAWKVMGPPQQHATEQEHQSRHLYRGKGVLLFEDRIETPQGIARFADGLVEATVHYPSAAHDPQVIVDAPDFVTVIPCKPKAAAKLAERINRAAWIGLKMAAGSRLEVAPGAGGFRERENSD
jgi:uncharacterized membrane-anchored protein